MSENAMDGRAPALTAFDGGLRSRVRAVFDYHEATQNEDECGYRFNVSVNTFDSGRGRRVWN
jgi:hypothetical protein